MCTRRAVSFGWQGFADGVGGAGAHALSQARLDHHCTPAPSHWCAPHHQPPLALLHPLKHKCNLLPCLLLSDHRHVRDNSSSAAFGKPFDGETLAGSSSCTLPVMLASSWFSPSESDATLREPVSITRCGYTLWLSIIQITPATLNP